LKWFILDPQMVRTHVAMFKRREMTVSQVADKVLYAGLIEVQEMELLKGRPPPISRQRPLIHETPTGRFA